MVSHVPGKFSRNNLLSPSRRNTEPIDRFSERISTASPFGPTLNHSNRVAFFIFLLYSSVHDTTLVPRTRLKSILVKTLGDLVLPALEKLETWRHTKLLLHPNTGHIN
ncbi:hypothetical protein PILCRDRAFT_968 [Piloderma croceum F 1598]|uniref:Uncharacterized protein n=1 Tax=Piloderma croceum (strain F 1598) TaxID=765440 RepID=A0A0C3BVY2_PILCF|nr:hypothetical protein PILCRDRAFT_968 [Piloderma croceum F 1598]